MFGDEQLYARLHRRSKTMAAEMAEAASKAGIPGEVFLDVGDSYAIFAGNGSPLTQGGGSFSSTELEAIQAFYSRHACGWEAIVTPFTSVDSFNRLLSLGATAMNWETVLTRDLGDLPSEDIGGGRFVEAEAGTLSVWSEVGRRGFFGEESNPVAEELARVLEHMTGYRRYIGYLDDEPAGAAAMSIRDGVVFLGGMATLPKFRRRGLQTAAIARRLRDALGIADLATMGAVPGSSSQRNAERLGFQVAWTQLSLYVPPTEIKTV